MRLLVLLLICGVMYPKLSTFVRGFRQQPFISLMGIRTRRFASGPEAVVDSRVPVTQWDLKNLQIEVTKQSGRAFKKIAKSLELNSSSPEPPLDSCKLAELRQRLVILNDIGGRLKNISSSEDEQFKSILSTLLDMGMDSHPPPEPVKIKKIKSPPVEPRKPYHAYVGSDNIEIWVGRGASDNDLLSCDPSYRHKDEWWMHVAGLAGSHVVIKSTANDLITRYPETVMDAAVLCAYNSKAMNQSSTDVTLTRCRNVSKPKGYVPGMVMLQGEASRVPVNFKKEKARLERVQNSKRC